MTFREFFSTSNWWGKIIGAILGYLTTRGPVGALLGIFIGNVFDRGFASHYSNPHLLYHTEKREAVQKAFFNATFSVMGYIAKADGRVSEREIEMARILMNDIRLSKAQKTLAKQLFSEGKAGHFKLDATLAQLRSMCRDNRELLKLFVDIQYKAAQVDGLNNLKIKALDKIFTELGFAPLHKQYRFYEDFYYQNGSNPFYGNQSQEQSYQKHDEQKEQTKNQYQRQQYNQYRPQYQSNNIDHAYALLEITPETSRQDAKKAYRRLLSRNHPDKLIAQGLPDEMIKLANEKTHKIMKAYELICEHKGWS